MAPGAARSTPPPSPAPDPRREGSPLHRAASVATTSTRGSRASCLLCRLRVVVPPPGCGAHRSPSRHPPLRRQERCVLLTMLAHHAAQMSDPSRWTRYSLAPDVFGFLLFCWLLGGDEAVRLFGMRQLGKKEVE
ncbi:uncharacterized protein [Triticum aestivum]|uniref:uncharacterized protein isoform X1 n=1 Tax=Triticum aestivum TaxID=4565 RepID=UPI001D0081F2|nr:uncharacterized protein LOC123189341 isoform X1 [Triticum aestivum]